MLLMWGDDVGYEHQSASGKLPVDEAAQGSHMSVHEWVLCPQVYVNPNLGLIVYRHESIH